MKKIQKIHFTACINQKEVKKVALTKLDFIIQVAELRKLYANSYFAIKDIYLSDTITIGSTNVIRRAA